MIIKLYYESKYGQKINISGYVLCEQNASVFELKNASKIQQNNL